MIQKVHYQIQIESAILPQRLNNCMFRNLICCTPGIVTKPTYTSSTKTKISEISTIQNKISHSSRSSSQSDHKTFQVDEQ